MRSFFALAGLVALLSATGAGCGEQTIESARDARAFTRNALRDGSASDWKLGSHAGAPAISAWEHRDAIDEMGTTLRENREWACHAADAIQRLGESRQSGDTSTLALSPEDEQQVLAAARERDPAVPETTVEDVVQLAERVSRSELVTTINVVCAASEL